MRFLKKSFLILLLPLFAFGIAHKFYVSVTSVGYSEKDAALQITTRIFIDDFEAVIKERYDIEAKLATDNESQIASDYIERYVRTKFKVEVNGNLQTYNFLGKKYDNDLIICYIEISDIDLAKIQSISVQNEILTDLYDEQQNIVHFKINDKKKSFVLVKGNNKGMLKF